jgi:hypothetical protein
MKDGAIICGDADAHPNFEEITNRVFGVVEE